ncbi:MAG: hypothetical protein ABIM29_04640 [candidate division WOR-3 bacterium]
MKFILIFLFLKGEYALEFLKFGAGAREISLSNSDIVLLSPSSAPLYNPACAISDNFSIMLNKSYAFDGIMEYNYLGFCLPLFKKIYLSSGFLILNIPDIPFYSKEIEPGDTNFYPPEKYFDFSQRAFLLNFSHKKFPFGINFKIINQKMLEAKGKGIGFDFGTRYSKFTKFGNFYFGFVLKDIGGTKVSWGDRERGEESPAYHFGFCYSKSFNFLNLKIFSNTFYDYDLYNSFGVESSFFETLFLRIGFLYFDYFSIGIGLKFKFFDVDYGFKKNVIGVVHSISLTFNKI